MADLGFLSILTGAGVALAGRYLYDRMYRDRIHVKQVKSARDRDAGKLIDLYLSIFGSDGTNYTGEELLEFLNEEIPGRAVKVENLILVAKYKGDVVAFLLAHHYPERRKAIVSYVGRDEGVRETKRIATRILRERLVRMLKSDGRSCEYLFYDIQLRGKDEESGSHRVLSSRFQADAAALSLAAYELKFEYVCPRISLTDGTEEYRSRLFCVPLRGELPGKLPRDQVLDMLRFIYLDCHGDLYRVSDPRFALYQNYLGEVLERFEQALPEQIPTSRGK